MKDYVKEMAEKGRKIRREQEKTMRKRQIEEQTRLEQERRTEEKKEENKKTVRNIYSRMRVWRRIPD